MPLSDCPNINSFPHVSHNSAPVLIISNCKSHHPKYQIVALVALCCSSVLLIFVHQLIVNCLGTGLFFWGGGIHPWYMEVPRLGIELELQLQAYTRVTAMPDLGHIWDLQCSSWQHQILNPLNMARDLTCISWIHQVCYHGATMGTPKKWSLLI